MCILLRWNSTGSPGVSEHCGERWYKYAALVSLPAVVIMSYREATSSIVATLASSHDHLQE